MQKEHNNIDNTRFCRLNEMNLTETKLPPLIGVATWWVGCIYECESVKIVILSVVHFSKFGCFL